VIVIHTKSLNLFG